MANIIPFKGYRFNSEKINDFGSVMAPPYDTISHSEQKSLYEMDNHNIVRLYKGMVHSNDTDVENSFTRSAAFLKEWIADEILVRDKKPTFYLYEQQVTYKNTIYRR